MNKRYWKREAYFYAAQAIRGLVNSGSWMDHDELREDPDSEDGRRFCAALKEVAESLERRA